MYLLGFLVILSAALCCSAQVTCKRPERRKEAELVDDAETFAPGTTIVFRCRPGYSRLGTIKMTCTNDGTWVTASPMGQCKLKSCGHPGDIDFGTFELTKESEFVFGAVVEYKCDDGYQMLSRQKTRQCTANGWSGAVPHCEVKRCPPVEVESGVNLLSTSFDDDEYSVGQVVRFECKNPKFKVEGEREIFCTSEGEWSANPPTCKEISCQKPQISNGVLSYPKNIYKEDERITYNCKPKYKPERNAEAICTKNGWSPEPSCVEIVCYPQKVINGNVPQDKAVYREEETIRVECNSGFQLEGDPNEPRRCTKNGWFPPLTCISRMCDKPEITHGSLYISSSYGFPKRTRSYIDYYCYDGYLPPTKTNYGRSTCTQSGWDPKPRCLRTCSNTAVRVENAWLLSTQNVYVSGEKVRFRCYQDYKTEDGNEEGERECLPTGTFTAARCTKSCKISALDHGTYEPKKGSFDIGQYLKYQCDVGFVSPMRNRVENVQCLAGGWQQTPQCIKITCSIPEENKLETLKNEYKEGEVVQLSCPFGYRLSDSAYSQCHYYGWDPSLPKCKEINCKIPPATSVSDVIREPDKNTYQVNEIVQLSCFDDHKLTGASNSKCTEYGWDPPIALCKEIVCSITNTDIETYYNNKRTVAHLETIDAKCSGESRYQRFKCTEFGWNPSLPACTKTNCEIPKIKFNSDVRKDPNKVKYEINEFVKLSCRSDYRLIGSSSSQCTEHGWEPPLPSCTEIVCNITNTDIETKYKKRTVKNGETVEAKCSGESNHQRFKCTQSGWDPSLPTCTRADPSTPAPSVSPNECPPAPHLKNARIKDRKSKYYNGDAIEIECNSDFKLFGLGLIRCQDGKWESLPQCIQSQECSKPPTIENGEMTEESAQDKYFTDTKVIFKCKAGYHISGSAESLCLKGQWTAAPVCAGDPCGKAPFFEFAFIDREKPNYQHNDRVEYKCLSGYKYEGESTTKCLEGKWFDLPTCVSNKCDPPKPIEFGKIISLIKDKYESGEKVKYECNRGFALEKNRNEAVCEDTRWIQTPVCKKIGESCGPPPAVEYGDTRQDRKTTYQSGSTVEYVCPNFYDVEGKAIIKCENGVWDDPPVCLEPCTAGDREMKVNNIKLKWKSDNKLYSKHGDNMTFVCLDGYEIHNVTLLRVQCIRSVLKYPKCIKIGSCVLSQTTMEQNSIYLNRTSEIENGETVEFKCNEGMVPETSLTATCRSNIINYPKCIADRKCVSTPNVPNGKLKSEQQDSYDSGVSVEFECDTGHVQSGSANVKCTNGEWSEIPKCLKPCTVSEEELNNKHIELRSQDDLDKSHTHGTEVNIKCKSGFRHQNQESLRLECIDGRMHYPKCFSKQTCRLDQDKLDENFLELDPIHNNENFYEEGDSVLFRCKQKYVNTSGTERTCTKGEVTYPTCSPRQETSV